MKRRDDDYWAADTPISMPEPPSRKVMVSFDGFGFCTAGLCHNLTQEERDEIAIPYFAPQPMPESGR